LLARGAVAQRGADRDNRRMKASVVLCTFPDAATAERIATALVEARLAACVNVVAGVTSTYRWQDGICRDSEVLLIAKTTDERFDALREGLLALHPYDVPEIIALDVVDGSAPYLDWIAASVSGDRSGA
jgi:periplasmic divalent cation tolerance protein